MATLNVSAALFAEHEICIFGNDVLRKKAEPIKKFDDALKQRVERMFRVMKATGDGVGLAAPQIGCSEQLVVAQVKMPTLPEDFPEEQKEALQKEISGLSKMIELTDHTGKATTFDDIVQFGRFAFANPVWKPVGDTKAPSREACLSLPGIMAKVPRYKKIVLNFQDLDGHPYTLQCDGLLAQIIQHETDHLNGILYVDHISDLCVVGEMPIWEVFPELYEQMKALKDEVLTKNKVEESRQEAEQEGREFKSSEKTFWISEKNKEKALAIIGKIGGEDHMFDYDTLLPQSETANNAVEAKSEAK
ncbi:MAG: peptide deformylase [Opitutales bacterium]|nr:peptide deformylase [Opitutales bacterium]